MIYEYVCDRCGRTREIDQAMNGPHPIPLCRLCASPMRRIFGARVHGDEIRGTKYFHPTRRTEVKDHGRIFDLGAGKWWESKSQRRNWIKKKGWQEHGIKEV